MDEGQTVIGVLSLVQASGLSLTMIDLLLMQAVGLSRYDSLDCFFFCMCAAAGKTALHPRAFETLLGPNAECFECRVTEKLGPKLPLHDL